MIIPSELQDIQAPSDKVIIRPLKQTRTTGGLHLPDTMQGQDTMVCQVIAVGPGNYSIMGELIPNCCKVGQRILIYVMGMAPFKFRGHDLAVITDGEVAAILPEGEAVELPPQAIAPLVDEIISPN